MLSEFKKELTVLAALLMSLTAVIPLAYASDASFNETCYVDWTAGETYTWTPQFNNPDTNVAIQIQGKWSDPYSGIIAENYASVSGSTVSVAIPSDFSGHYLVTVIGSNGTQTASYTIILCVPPVALVYNGNNTITATTNETVNFAPSLEGTLPDDLHATSYTLQSGSLPAGWSLDPATGVISGKASQAVSNKVVLVKANLNAEMLNGGTTKTVTATVKITVSAGSTGPEKSLSVSAAPQSATKGETITITPAVTTSDNSVTSYTLSATVNKSDATVSVSGKNITFSATKAGSYIVTITAAASGYASGTTTVRVDVTEPAELVFTNAPTASYVITGA